MSSLKSTPCVFFQSASRMSPTTTNISVDTQRARKKRIRTLVQGAPTIPVSMAWWYPSIPPITLSRCVLWSQLRFLRVREPTRLVCVSALSHVQLFVAPWTVAHACVCVCVRAHIQLCTALCDPMNCSPPGSSVHGLLQARVLEWVPMPSSRGSSQPRAWTCISCINHYSTWEVPAHSQIVEKQLGWDLSLRAVLTTVTTVLPATSALILFSSSCFVTHSVRNFSSSRRSRLKWQPVPLRGPGKLASGKCRFIRGVMLWLSQVGQPCGASNLKN